MPSDDPFDDIFDEFERMVDELFGAGVASGKVGESDARVDVHARDDGIEVVADLPGATADEVNLLCDGRTLRIETGDAVEVVELPVVVDETSADASFNNGVLSVGFERADDGGATVDVH